MIRAGLVTDRCDADDGLLALLRERRQDGGKRQ